IIDAVGEAPRAVYQTDHPDLLAHGLDLDEIVRRIPEGVDAVGVSVLFSLSWPHANALCEKVRARFPNVPIIGGGGHIPATSEDPLRDCPAVTICVLGEGEAIAVDLMDWVDARCTLEAIAGIAYRVDGVPRLNSRRARLTSLREIPWPAWDLVPVEN